MTVRRGRKRKDLGHDVEALIRALMARGGTSESIARALAASGVRGVSRATIDRRMRELRGPVAAPRAQRAGSRRSAPMPRPAPPPPAPMADDELPSEDAIPETAGIANLRRWLALADRGGRAALERGDLGTVGVMGRLIVALSAAIRKATPPALPRLEDQPDMRVVAERARAKLQTMIGLVVAEASGAATKEKHHGT